MHVDHPLANVVGEHWVLNLLWLCSLDRATRVFIPWGIQGGNDLFA